MMWVMNENDQSRFTAYTSTHIEQSEKNMVWCLHKKNIVCFDARRARNFCVFSISEIDKMLASTDAKSHIVYAYCL